MTTPVCFASARGTGLEYAIERVPSPEARSDVIAVYMMFANDARDLFASPLPELVFGKSNPAGVHSNPAGVHKAPLKYNFVFKIYIVPQRQKHELLLYPHDRHGASKREG